MYDPNITLCRIIEHNNRYKKDICKLYYTFSLAKLNNIAVPSPNLYGITEGTSLLDFVHYKASTISASILADYHKILENKFNHLFSINVESYDRIVVSINSGTDLLVKSLFLFILDRGLLYSEGHPLTLNKQENPDYLGPNDKVNEAINWYYKEVGHFVSEHNHILHISLSQEKLILSRTQPSQTSYVEYIINVEFLCTLLYMAIIDILAKANDIYIKFFATKVKFSKITGVQ